MLYDFVRVFFGGKFDKIREDSYENDTLSYPIFFFCLLTILEFLPTWMFVLNLKYTWKKGIVLTKKLVVEEKKGRKGSFKTLFTIQKEDKMGEDNIRGDTVVRSKGSAIESSKKTDSLIGDYD